MKQTELRCKKCNSILTHLEDDLKMKEDLEKIGIPYVGHYKCLNCYPIIKVLK